MKIRFMGKYNNDPSSLPKGEMVEGSNRIKKIDNLAILTIVMTVLSCVFLYILGMLLIDIFGKELLSKAGVFAVFMSLACNIVHEYIHAICFKEESYIYIGNGLLFAMSPEHMTKNRYLFMLLLPFLVLGVIPFVTGLLFYYSPLAIFGVISMVPCSGDLYMALSALFQVPAKGKIYLYDMINYWYV